MRQQKLLFRLFTESGKAEKYASYVGDERLMKLHLDVIIPGTDRERARAALLKLAEIYNNYGILPNLPLAAGRITMINGFRDMTMYGNYVHDRKEQLKGWVKASMETVPLELQK